MRLPHVFVCRDIDADALQRIRSFAMAEVWMEANPPPPSVIYEKATHADGILTLLTDRIDETILIAAPNLRIVSNMAVGFDNIDVAACTRHGVLVGITPGVLTETSADFAFALLLSAARRVV